MRQENHEARHCKLYINGKVDLFLYFNAESETHILCRFINDDYELQLMKTQNPVPQKIIIIINITLSN